MFLLDATNYNASDSEESLLPDERGSFADKQPASTPADSPFKEKQGLRVNDLIKQQAKEQAVSRTNQPSSGQLGPRGKGSAASKLGRDPSSLQGYGGANGKAAMGSSVGNSGGKILGETGKGVGASKAAGQGLGKGGKANVDVVGQVKDVANKIPVAGEYVSAKIEDLQDKEGRAIGFLVWLIWGILSLVGGVLLITIAAAPLSILVILIWNLMLVSPKLVYKITVFILDLFGIGEFLHEANTTGLINEDKITINDFEKLLIIFFDLLVIGLIMLMLVIFISVSCWLGEQTGILGSGFAKIVISGLDWWNGTQYSGFIDQICTSVRQF